MNNTTTVGSETGVSGRKARWKQGGILGVTCALVVGIYAYGARSGVLESFSLNAADTYYNLLEQGFRAGQLSLKKEAPPGLAQLADPYDPSANAPYWSEPYRMLDLSYYKGRLYLYWGATPVLILFWPFAALTGHYLFHRQAVAIFCAVGFLASVGVLRALWRRYFAEVSVWVVMVCVLALGLATGAPAVLPRSDVYEVPISCGYMLTMLALGAVWCALHETEPRKCSGWLAAASVVYGLAVGARPSLLFGAVILLVPVIQAWREHRTIGGLLTAAIGPIAVVGLGLMLYNALRFDSPFEFGLRDQLGPGRQDKLQYFSLGFLWFHFRVYFLEPVHWSSHFPFVREIALPLSPLGHYGSMDRPFDFLTNIPLNKPFGVLTNIPLVWLALAAPLAWRGRSAADRSMLRGFLAAVTAFLGICALTICLFRGGNLRYEVDFLPAFVLLAVVGIVGLERVLAERPAWRRAGRCGWGLVLGFSVVLNLLVGTVNYAEAHCYTGNALLRAGKIEDAVRHYELALRINQDLAEAHNNLATALMHMGKFEDVIAHYEQTLRINPDRAETHNNLGIVLCRVGRLEVASGHFEEALRLKPDYAEAHYNLGLTLEQEGKVQEAIGHYQQALQIKPDLTAAQNGLARLQAVP